LKLGANIARTQVQYGLSPLAVPLAVARDLTTASGTKAAITSSGRRPNPASRQPVPNPLADARQALQKKTDLMTDNARYWGGVVADGTREWLDDAAVSLRTAPERLESNLDTYVPRWRDYRDTIAAIPEWVADTARNLANAPIRDGRKYFTEINPYRAAQALRVNGIADPNSPAATAVLAEEKRFSDGLYAHEKAKWNAIADWAKPFQALHYGAERGAFGPAGALARTYVRTGGWQEDAYQAERLPYTFALEDHPFAYGAGYLVGNLASDRVSRGVAGLAGSAVDGYLSEPADTPARLVNAGASLAGDWLAGEVAKPLQAYAKRAVKRLGRRVFAAPPFALPPPVVRSPPTSGAPFALPGSGIEPPVVRVTPPASPLTRQAHFEGPIEPFGNGWNFTPDPARTRYGLYPNPPSSADGSKARFFLDSRLEALRPDISPTLSERVFEVAPEVAEATVKEPIDRSLMWRAGCRRTPSTP
jgi:hypothetical protein